MGLFKPISRNGEIDLGEMMGIDNPTPEIHELDIEVLRDDALTKFFICYNDPPLMSDLDEALAAISKGVDVHVPGSTILPDFETARMILELLDLDPHTIDELISHEVAHASKAEEFGIQWEPMITVYHESENRKGIQLSIKVDYPDELLSDPQRFARIQREIYSAPEDMSDTDNEGFNQSM